MNEKNLRLKSSWGLFFNDSDAGAGWGDLWRGETPCQQGTYLVSSFLYNSACLSGLALFMCPNLKVIFINEQSAKSVFVHILYFRIRKLNLSVSVCSMQITFSLTFLFIDGKTRSRTASNQKCFPNSFLFHFFNKKNSFFYKWI